MFSSESLTVTFRADLGLLTARWLQEPPVARVQLDYEAVLAAALSYGATRWLLDVRRRPAIDPDLADWISHDWLPRVVARLPAGLRMAYLISPLRAQAVRDNPELGTTIDEVLATSEACFIRLFDDEAGANA